MAYTVPDAADFRAYFFRDFPYADDPEDLTKVQSIDIEKALAEASINVNQGLFRSQADFTVAYLYLTAHCLVMNLRAASQGIAGQYAWLQTNKAVGSVSEGFQVPERILANPYFAMLSKTNYGAKFISIVEPLLTGQMFATFGGVHA